ncbi:MAG: hypothetical protein Q4F00_02915 [bacterium]|nr:hypothetical protein [bacterium]
MKQLIRNTAKIAAVMSLAAALSAGLTACGDSESDNVGSSGPVKAAAAEGSVAEDSAVAEGPAIVDASVEPTSEEVYEGTAYFGDISALSEGMQETLRQRFPKQAAADEADVIFCTSEEYERSADLQNSKERGAVVVIVRPDVEQQSSSLKLAVDSRPTGLSSGDVLFYAHCNSHKQYTVYGEQGFDAGEPQDNLLKTDIDVYNHGRVVPLLRWLNQRDREKSLIASSDPSAVNDGYNYDSLVTDIDSAGVSLTANFPFSLNEECGKCYKLQAKHKINASSSVDVNFKVYPLYMQSCNGAKAGDYYAVTCAITPYNQNMWQTWHCSSGWLSEVFMVGYWFNHMATTVRLLDSSGNPIEGAQYFQMPVPENAINSHQYSNGISNTFSGSICGGSSSKAPLGNISASFSRTVNSSTSYSMDDIDYTLDSSTNQPHYDYNSKNVKPSKSDNWDKYWPKNCRTQWTVRQAWVWFVPRGVAGVDDNSKTAFKLSFDGLLEYSNYSWLRVTADRDKESDVKTFRPIWVKGYTWDLPAPDRRTWGMISIKNAAKNALSNLKFYRKGEEDKDPAAVLDMSYNVNEVAEIALPEGEYTVTFETIDPDKDNQKLADWKFENVVVKQGQDKAAATTALSSVNAKKID